eukprot:GHVU01117612.1.p1 GENE.GHVU01117612.1~~GHVU01117612.1.p1  ORF type:complete len:655 (+),score=110.99 GHVU01117612.1:2-1966(+)
MKRTPGALPPSLPHGGLQPDDSSKRRISRTMLCRMMKASLATAALLWLGFVTIAALRLLRHGRSSDASRQQGAAVDYDAGHAPPPRRATVDTSVHFADYLALYRKATADPNDEAAALKFNQTRTMIKQGKQFIDPSMERQHGLIGIFDNGTARNIEGPPPSDSPIESKLQLGGGFNIELSDHLPLSRTIMDYRPAECKGMDYDISTLPHATVIIVFYNEPFSTLFRSVHSVLDRTPPELLNEIILVDDGSDKVHIREGGNNQVLDYANSLAKTRMIRNPKRLGIVGARMLGIRASASPIFVILDSHIEVQSQWLEPIVKRIGEDKTAIVMPAIDGCDARTLAHQSGGIGCTLGFLWKMMEHGYVPGPTSPKARLNKDPRAFITSPTMAGGLFAASREFFFSIGGYDEGFQFWGTENLEFSFRVWQCGGRLECSKCSRVFHIFRDGGHGYSSPADAVLKNKMRTVAIWMDEYSHLAWKVSGAPKVNYGDVSSQRKIREQLGCRSFNWFLNEVWPESVVRSLPADVPYLGPISLREKNDTCVAGGSGPGKRMHLKRDCENEYMYFKNTKQIMIVSNDESCITTDAETKSEWCHENQHQWDYDPESGMLKTVKGGLCLTATIKPPNLSANKCDAKNTMQKWDFPKYEFDPKFVPPTE